MRVLLPVVTLATLSACHSSPGAVPAGPMAGARFDAIITGGRVVDGTGNAWFLGDVGVRGDRIAHVGPAGTLARATAPLRIDAGGMVVAPGFVDIQSGSYDNFLTGDGRSLGKVTQGVTTEIMGEAYTPAPWHDNLEPFREFFFTAKDSEAARAVLQEFRGARGFGTWLGAMERHGISVNVGSFLGASTVRAYAKGHAEGPASSAELDTMRAVMRRAMEDGALGLGTALIYPPAATPRPRSWSR